MKRPDGSTPHCFDFDPVTGAPIGPATMFRRTGETDFLRTARRLADFALGALTPDNVPVWDYTAPQNPFDVKDASAGVIMACGLLDLATASHDERYRVAGIRILDAISRTCLTTRSTRADAVVARCTRNRPAEDGIEISLRYGDYYLLEGLLRLLRPNQLAKAIGL
jgi:unsaturated chondroitin disaccharide hydrolase